MELVAANQRIEELQHDIGQYVELASERERRIEELESELEKAKIRTPYRREDGDT